MGHLTPLRVDLLGLSIFLVILATQTTAAPVQENSNSVSRFSNDKGCYYMNKLYPSGERIETNESCLNCTCIGNTLMCYLRVCPFVKPIGEHCISEQHVGDCCPKFWCPEAYPRATTEAPDSEPRGCYLDGRYYDEGARIPMDPLKPCEVCYCIRNTSVCTVQECELKVDGCFPQYKVGSCCPSRYNCTEEAATTIPPGVMEPEEYEGCKVDGVMYKDGEQVSSKDNCENCYCMKHEVVCAVQECPAPAADCIPQEVEEGQCCPTKYECPPTTEVPVWLTTRPPSLQNVTDLPPVSDLLTTLSGELDDRIRQTFTEQEGESFPTKVFTEGKPEVVTGSTLETITPIGLVTTEILLENGTLPSGDLVSRPREPKITEVPDDMFTSAALPKATGRPVFYPSRPIPGEGICRHDNKTYQNKQSIPSADPCRLNCTCLNSVVLCERVECVLSPPESGTNCKVTKLPDECCPKYVCDTPSGESVETIAPSDVVTDEQPLMPPSLSTTLPPIETTEASMEVTTEQVQKEITIESESFTKPTTISTEAKETEKAKEAEEESETTLASITAAPISSNTSKTDEETAEDVEASTLELSSSHEASSATPGFTQAVTETTPKALITEEVKDDVISATVSTTKKEEEEVTLTTALPTSTAESEISSIELATEKEISVTGIHARTKSTTPVPPTGADESTESTEAKPTTPASVEKQETEGKPTHLVTELTTEEIETSTHEKTDDETISILPTIASVLTEQPGDDKKVTSEDSSTESSFEAETTKSEVTSELDITSTKEQSLTTTVKEEETTKPPSTGAFDLTTLVVKSASTESSVISTLESKTTTSSAKDDVAIETHGITTLGTSPTSQEAETTESKFKETTPVEIITVRDESTTASSLSSETTMSDVTTVTHDVTSAKEATTEAKAESPTKPSLVETTVSEVDKDSFVTEGIDEVTTSKDVPSTSEVTTGEPLMVETTKAAETTQTHLIESHDLTSEKEEAITELETESTTFKPLTSVKTTVSGDVHDLTEASETTTHKESTTSHVEFETTLSSETTKLDATAVTRETTILSTTPKPSTEISLDVETEQEKIFTLTSKEFVTPKEITTTSSIELKTTVTEETTEGHKTTEIQDVTSSKEELITELELETTPSTMEKLETTASETAEDSLITKAHDVITSGEGTLSTKETVSEVETTRAPVSMETHDTSFVKESTTESKFESTTTKAILTETTGSFETDEGISITKFISTTATPERTTGFEKDAVKVETTMAAETTKGHIITESPERQDVIGVKSTTEEIIEGITSTHVPEKTTISAMTTEKIDTSTSKQETTETKEITTGSSQEADTTESHITTEKMDVTQLKELTTEAKHETTTSTLVKTTLSETAGDSLVTKAALDITSSKDTDLTSEEIETTVVAKATEGPTTITPEVTKEELSTEFKVESTSMKPVTMTESIDTETSAEAIVTTEISETTPEKEISTTAQKEMSTLKPFAVETTLLVETTKEQKNTSDLSSDRVSTAESDRATTVPPHEAQTTLLAETTSESISDEKDVAPTSKVTTAEPSLSTTKLVTEESEFTEKVDEFTTHKPLITESTMPKISESIESQTTREGTSPVTERSTDFSQGEKFSDFITTRLPFITTFADIASAVASMTTLISDFGKTSETLPEIGSTQEDEKVTVSSISELEDTSVESTTEMEEEGTSQTTTPDHEVVTTERDTQSPDTPKFTILPQVLETKTQASTVEPSVETEKSVTATPEMSTPEEASTKVPHKLSTTSDIVTTMKDVHTQPPESTEGGLIKAKTPGESDVTESSEPTTLMLETEVQTERFSTEKPREDGLSTVKPFKDVTTTHVDLTTISETTEITKTAQEETTTITTKESPEDEGIKVTSTTDKDSGFETTVVKETTSEGTVELIGTTSEVQHQVTDSEIVTTEEPLKTTLHEQEIETSHLTTLSELSSSQTSQDKDVSGASTESTEIYTTEVSEAEEHFTLKETETKPTGEPSKPNTQETTSKVVVTSETSEVTQFTTRRPPQLDIGMTTLETEHAESSETAFATSETQIPEKLTTTSESKLTTHSLEGESTASETAATETSRATTRLTESTEKGMLDTVTFKPTGEVSDVETTTVAVSKGTTLSESTTTADALLSISKTEGDIAESDKTTTSKADSTTTAETQEVTKLTTTPESVSKTTLGLEEESVASSETISTETSSAGSSTVTSVSTEKELPDIITFKPFSNVSAEFSTSEAMSTTPSAESTTTEALVTTSKTESDISPRTTTSKADSTTAAETHEVTKFTSTPESVSKTTLGVKEEPVASTETVSTEAAETGPTTVILVSTEKELPDIITFKPFSNVSAEFSTSEAESTTALAGSSTTTDTLVTTSKTESDDARKTVTFEEDTEFTTTELFTTDDVRKDTKVSEQTSTPFHELKTTTDVHDVTEVTSPEQFTTSTMEVTDKLIPKTTVVTDLPKKAEDIERKTDSDEETAKTTMTPALELSSTAATTKFSYETSVGDMDDSKTTIFSGIIGKSRPSETDEMFTTRVTDSESPDFMTEKELTSSSELETTVSKEKTGITESSTPHSTTQFATSTSSSETTELKMTTLSDSTSKSTAASETKESATTKLMVSETGVEDKVTTHTISMSSTTEEPTQKDITTLEAEMSTEATHIQTESSTPLQTSTVTSEAMEDVKPAFTEVTKEEHPITELSLEASTSEPGPITTLFSTTEKRMDEVTKQETSPSPVDFTGESVMEKSTGTPEADLTTTLKTEMAHEFTDEPKLPEIISTEQATTIKPVTELDLEITSETVKERDETVSTFAEDEKESSTSKYVSTLPPTDVTTKSTSSTTKEGTEATRVTVASTEKTSESEVFEGTQEQEDKTVTTEGVTTREIVTKAIVTETEEGETTVTAGVTTVASTKISPKFTVSEATKELEEGKDDVTTKEFDVTSISVTTQVTTQEIPTEQHLTTGEGAEDLKTMKPEIISTEFESSSTKLPITDHISTKPSEMSTSELPEEELASTTDSPAPKADTAVKSTVVSTSGAVTATSVSPTEFETTERETTLKPTTVSDRSTTLPQPVFSENISTPEKISETETTQAKDTTPSSTETTESETTKSIATDIATQKTTEHTELTTESAKSEIPLTSTSITSVEEDKTTSTILKTSHDGITTKDESETGKTTAGATVSSEMPSTVAPESTSVFVSEKPAEDKDSDIIPEVTEISELQTTSKTSTDIPVTEFGVTKHVMTEVTTMLTTEEEVEETRIVTEQKATTVPERTTEVLIKSTSDLFTAEKETEAAGTETLVSTTEESYPTTSKTTEVTKEMATTLEISTPASEGMVSSKETVVSSTMDQEFTSPTFISHDFTAEIIKSTSHEIQEQEVTTHTAEKETTTAKPLETSVTEAETQKTSIKEDEKPSPLLPKTAVTDEEKSVETTATTVEPETTEPEVTVVSEEVLTSNHTFGIDSMVKEHSTTPATTFITEKEEKDSETTLAESTTMKLPASSDFAAEISEKETTYSETTTTPKAQTTESELKKVTVLPSITTVLPSDDVNPTIHTSEVTITADTEAEQKITTGSEFTTDSHDASTTGSETTLRLTTRKEAIETSTAGITTKDRFTDEESTTKEMVSEETKLFSAESETSTPSFTTTEKIQTESSIIVTEETEEQETIHAVTVEASETELPLDASTVRTKQEEAAKKTTLIGDSSTSAPSTVTEKDVIQTTSSTYVSDTVGSEAMETTVFGRTAEKHDITQTELSTEQDKTTHATEKTTFKMTTTSGDLFEQSTPVTTGKEQYETRKEHETTKSEEITSEDKHSTPEISTFVPLEFETSTSAEHSTVKPETTEVHEATDLPTETSFKPHTTEGISIKTTELVHETASPSEKDDTADVTEIFDGEKTTEPASTSADELVPKSTISHEFTESTAGEVATGASSTAVAASDETTTGGVKDSVITSEPVSPVTESTSSTATTTTVSVTEVATRSFSEADFVTVQETEETTIIPLSTATSPDEVPDMSMCVINGTLYDNGDPIDTTDPCEKCHCVEGTISCFKIICKVPKQGCFPDEHKIHECCPSTYKCPSDKNETEFVSTLKEVVTQKDLTTPIPISFMFSTLPTSISSTILVTKAPFEELSTLRVDLSTTGKDIITPEKSTEGITTPGQVELTTKPSAISSIVPSDDTKDSTLEPKELVTELVASTIVQTISTKKTEESSKITTEELGEVLSTEKTTDELDHETTEKSLTTPEQDKTTLGDSEEGKTIVTFGFTSPTGEAVDATVKSTAPESDDVPPTTVSDIQRVVEEHIPPPEPTSDTDDQRNVEEHVARPEPTSATESDEDRKVHEPDEKSISETDEVFEETSPTTAGVTEEERGVTGTSETATHKEVDQPITVKETLTTSSTGLTDETEEKTTRFAEKSTTEGHEPAFTPLHGVAKVTTKLAETETSTVTELSIESSTSIDRKETTVSGETTSVRFTDSTEKSSETELDQILTTTTMPVKLPKLDDTFTTTAQTTVKEMTSEKPEFISSKSEVQETEMTSTEFSSKDTEMSEQFTTSSISITTKLATKEEPTAEESTTLKKGLETSSDASITSEAITAEVSQETTTYSPLPSTRIHTVTSSEEGIKSVTKLSSEKPSQVITETATSPGTENIFDDGISEGGGDEMTVVTETPLPTSSTFMPTASFKSGDLTTSESLEKFTEKLTGKPSTTVVHETEKIAETETTSMTAASETEEDQLELTTPASVIFGKITAPEDTETPELVTETVETKVTFVSLSKEGTTRSPGESTGLITETEVSKLESDAVTTKEKSPTTEQYSTELTPKSDEISTTDKIFQFVSTRFTTIPSPTIPSEVSKEATTSSSKSVTEEDLETISVFITQRSSEKDTEPVEDSELTTKLPVTSTVTTISTEEVITTKRPSIKALDDVETSETTMEVRTTSSPTSHDETTEPSVTSTTSVVTERATEQGVLIPVRESSETPATEETTVTTEESKELSKEEPSESTVLKIITTPSPAVKLTTAESVTDEVTEILTLSPKSVPSTEGKTTETIPEDLKSTTFATTFITKDIRDEPVKFTEKLTTEAQETETVPSEMTSESQTVSTKVQDMDKTEEEALLSVTSTPASTKSEPTFVTELENKTFITSTEKVMDIFTDNVTSSEESDVEPTSTLASLVTAFKERIRTTISPLFYLSTEQPLVDSTKLEETIITEKPSFGEGFTVMTDREDGIKTEVTTAERDEGVTELSSTPQGTVVSTLMSTEVSETSKPSTTESPAFKTGELFTSKETEQSVTTEKITDKPQFTTLTSLDVVTKNITERTTESETNVTTEGPITTEVFTPELTTEKEPEQSTLGVTERIADDKIVPKSTSLVDETIDISEAETTTAGEARQPTVTEITTPRPTEVVTKAFKAIETTPMPTPSLEADNTTDDEDFLLDEGSCIFEGRIYQSAEQIPRADACEFCFCFRGDIICLQQSCPPPAPNCHRTMIPGYCCPRYDCPVLVTSRNISSLSRRKGVQPYIIQKRIEKRSVRAPVEVKGCQINGTFYQVGQTVAKSSGPCLHCMCEDGGNMRCDPQKCKPEAPLMLKMNNSYFRRR